MPFVLKSFPQILEDLVAYVVANSPLTDINPGSVMLTILEAISNEDFQQYLSMVDILKAKNIDTATGDDLAVLALEYGVTKKGPIKTTGEITIGDSSFTKISSKIYAGLPPPIAGQTSIFSETDPGYPPGGGTIIIGRGTNNIETIVYTSVSQVGSAFKFILAAGLANPHGVEETIIFAQGGVRFIPAGSTCFVPLSDVNPQLNYTTINDASILDGEQEITGVLVIAAEAGSVYNAPAGAVNKFASLPFPTATVNNPKSFTNGHDEQSDQELRDEVKTHIQSLSKATKVTVTSQEIGVTSADQQSTITSTKFIEATVLDQPSFLYINDNAGLEPTHSGIGYEILAQLATGGEKYFQLGNYPLVKASLSTLSLAPYDFTGAALPLALRVSVDDIEEEQLIQSSAFSNAASASAIELAAHINNIFTLIEARTINGHTGVIIQAKDVTHEKIKIIAVSGGHTDVNSILNFPSNIDVYTLNLYLNDLLLTKDGQKATIETQDTQSKPWDMSGLNKILTIRVDGTNVQTVTFSGPFVDATHATADEIITNINAQLAGATATKTVDNKVIITSNNPILSRAKLQVTGGNANVQLVFTTSLITGTDAQYFLNRYNGQIKLVNTLVAGDRLSAGSILTRGWLQCVTPGPYTVNALDIRVVVDGGAAQTATFTGIGLSAAGMAAVLNVATWNDGGGPYIGPKGFTFFAFTLGVNSYLAVRTNTWGSGGSIEVTSAGTTAAALDFPRDVIVSNQAGSVAFIESTNSQNFTFGRDQYIIVVLDGDNTNRTFNIPLFQAGVVSNRVAPNTTTTFRAAALTSVFSVTDSLKGCAIQFDDATTTAADRNSKSFITAYNGATGDMTISPALPSAPVTGDSFQIHPATAKNVVAMFTNPHFTALGIYATIEATSNGQKVTISASAPGSAKTVDVTGGTGNTLSIPFTTNGTVGGTTTTDIIAGLSKGLAVTLDDDNSGTLDVFVENIVGAAAPYTILFNSTWPPTVNPDIRAYTTDHGAVILDKNEFHFQQTTKEGVDAYKYYTGTLREAQKVLDGYDPNLLTYPGLKAAGVQIEVTTPIEVPVRLNIHVVTDAGVQLSTIINQCRAVVSTYIQSLGIGGDVILTEITYRLQQISGVYDVIYITPLANIPISDNAQANLSDSDLIIG